MHQGQRAGEALVGQVGEERLQLAGRQHPLVDDGAGRQRREVGPGLVLRPLAQDVGPALQRVRRQLGRGQEDLAHHRHDLRRRPAKTGTLGVDGQVAPGEDLQALLARDPLDDELGVDRCPGPGRQEGRAHGVRPGRRQVGEQRPVERVRDLRQDARAVTTVGLTAGGTPVLEVAQRGQALLDEVVARPAGDVHDEGDPAGVVLLRRVVQTLSNRHGGGGGEGDGHRAGLPSGWSTGVSRNNGARSCHPGRHWPCCRCRSGYTRPGFRSCHACPWMTRSGHGAVGGAAAP